MSIYFSLSAIEAYVGERSYRLGMEYYRQDMVHSMVAMGPLLQGRCMGSEPYSYYVEVLFETKTLLPTIKKSKCSCPVRHYCKHIATFLIAWNDNPGSFRQQQELMSYLSKQKKDWLVDLFLEFAEKDSAILEQLFKIKDGKARRRARKGKEFANSPH